MEVMKIQCDACNAEEASVFCTADEAALCEGCDRRVHHANKLASKHHRFSLLHPSCKEAPRCDICKERRAFLFCREDRAILCRECDLPIHTANELTKMHSRFLLTGVRLSSYTKTDQTIVDDGKKSVLPETPFPIEKTTPSVGSEEACTSSISEYLIKMLPGWHVEEFLDSLAAEGPFKTTDETWPFVEADIGSDLSFGSNDPAIWFPQVPQVCDQYIAAVDSWQGGTGFKEISNATRVSGRWNDDGFEVPQLTPPSKRLRPTWYG